MPAKGITNPPFPPSSGGAGGEHAHARKGITNPPSPRVRGEPVGGTPMPAKALRPPFPPSSGGAGGGHGHARQGIAVLSPPHAGEQVSSCGGAGEGHAHARQGITAPSPPTCGGSRSSHAGGASGGQVFADEWSRRGQVRTRGGPAGGRSPSSGEPVEHARRGMQPTVTIQ